MLNIINLSIGTLTSLALTLSSLAVGLLLAVIFIFALNSNKSYFIFPTKLFIFFTRGVPLIVQIFMVYYGAAQFEWLRSSMLWNFFEHPFCCAFLVLGLNSSAYTTVILQTALAVIPKGEIEACQLFEMSIFTRTQKIILPRLLGNFWPNYSNEAIMVLKSTSIASTISLMDLMGVTKQIISNSYETAPALIIAGVIYLSIAFIFSMVMNKLDQHFKL